jgi:hypothetical protein
LLSKRNTWLQQQVPPSFLTSSYRTSQCSYWTATTLPDPLAGLILKILPTQIEIEMIMIARGPSLNHPKASQEPTTLPLLPCLCRVTSQAHNLQSQRYDLWLGTSSLYWSC